MGYEGGGRAGGGGTSVACLCVLLSLKKPTYASHEASVVASGYQPSIPPSPKGLPKQLKQLLAAQAPMVSVGDEEPAMVVANLRKALAEIDELSAERASIEEALKEERNRDNILPKLMASSGRSDNIFVEEIKKYDELKVGL